MNEKNPRENEPDRMNEEKTEFPDAMESAQDQKIVEAFSPSDYFYEQPKAKAKRKKKRRLSKRARTVLTAVLGLFMICLLGGGIYVHNITKNPTAFFNPSKATPTPQTEMLGVAESMEAITPAPTATPSELEALTAQADEDMMNSIINIALIGVDYAEERETWNGKHDYHADVIMVMAVNFDKKRVDLISIPRDTYANIPGVKGIYKINGSINCGGGFEAEGGAGFLKTCEAASWMLGGIPVDYYYAVTMPAVKQLADAFGGVDYDLELSFTMAGRKYYKGQQHMDGQGVLDYLRVRKNVSSSGDLNRINRQKDMLVALFNQMKTNNLIVKIPQILSAFDGQLFTNCSLSQTAALARFAYDLNAENIGMYSMDGRMTNIFNWNFVLTDQDKRVEIIKAVYGIDVPVERAYTSTYAAYRWQSMLAEQYLKTTKSFRDDATNAIKNGALESNDGYYEEPGDAGGDGGENEGNGGGDDEIFILEGAMARPFLPDRTLGAPVMPGSNVLSGYTQTAYDSYVSFVNAYDELTQDLEYANEQADQYLNGESNKLSNAVGSLRSDNENLKTFATNTAAYLDLSVKFNWNVIYYKDSSFNEVYVDFR